MAAAYTLGERAMPSEQQSAEWGVRAMKGPFKILTVRLPADAYKWKRILLCCVHLFNFRTHFVGLNHLRIVYSGNAAGAQPWVGRAEFRRQYKFYSMNIRLHSSYRETEVKT